MSFIESSDAKMYEARINRVSVPTISTVYIVNMFVNAFIVLFSLLKGKSFVVAAAAENAMYSIRLVLLVIPAAYF